MNKKLLNSVLYFLNRMYDIERISYTLSLNTNIQLKYKFCTINVHFWDENELKILDSLYIIIRNEKEFEDAKLAINNFIESNGVILLKTK